MVDEKKLEQYFKELIEFLGDDPSREGLRDTPKRMVRMYKELCAGYSMNLDEIINGAVFTSEYSEMVIVRDIEFYSLCEHHILPFFGKVHVGYVPNGRIIGLSKIPRIVEMFSRRLQVQERLTEEIASTLMKVIEPLGVGVVVEGYHMCTVMRGVKKHSAYMVTSAMLGVFRKDARTRDEFLKLIRKRGDIL